MVEVPLSALLAILLRSAVLPFQEINVSLGDNRYFIDKGLEQALNTEKNIKQFVRGYTE